MGLVALKIGMAAGLFAWGALSALSARAVRGSWPRVIHLCNSVAAGVLVSVAVVHMLSESQGELGEWGLAVAAGLTGCAAGPPAPGAAEANAGSGTCEPFPVGPALFVAGLMLIVAVEHGGWAPARDAHTLGAEDGSQYDRAVREPGNGVGGSAVRIQVGPVCFQSDDESGSGSSSEAATGHRDRAGTGGTGRSRASSVAGVGTAASVSVHSVIEAVAMGSSNDLGAFTSLLLAVALHKGFTSFAVGSALAASEDATLYAWGVLAYSLASPLGIIFGVLISSLEGCVAAAAQCFAAGTLLAIGVLDLLVPSLAAGTRLEARCNLLAASASALAMALLAAWL